MSKTPEYDIWAGCRYKAKKAGYQSDITLEDVKIPDNCPVLGMPLDKFHLRDNKDHWPTTDRIVPQKGYMKSNICIISLRANRIKSDSSIEELEKILSYMKDRIPK